MEAARKSLSRALNGDRATYCKLHFEFVNLLNIYRQYSECAYGGSKWFLI